MNNPLVEQEEQAPDGSGPLTEGTGEAGWGTGIGIAESVNDVSSLEDGSSWVESGLAYGGLAMEAVSLAVDPIGTLMSYGLSWLIEHVEPLQEALDWFAGDPDGVRAYGETWGNVSQEVNEAAKQYSAAVEADVAQWLGAAGDAYRGHAAERGEALSGAAELASTISSVVTIMGEVVSFVREFVRDLVADCVSRLITYALEAIGTLGLGTPVVAAQATTFVSKTVTKIAEIVQKLTKTISNVSPKLKKMVDVFGEIMSSLGKIGKKTAEGAGRVADKIDVSGKVADRVAESSWRKFDDAFGTDISGKHPDGGGGSGSGADPNLAPESGGGPDSDLTGPGSDSTAPGGAPDSAAPGPRSGPDADSAAPGGAPESPRSGPDAAPSAGTPASSRPDPGPGDAPSSGESPYSGRSHDSPGGSGPERSSPASPYGGADSPSAGVDAPSAGSGPDPGPSASGDPGPPPPRSDGSAEGGTVPSPEGGFEGEPPTGSTAPDGSPAAPDPRVMTFSGELSSGGGVPDAGGGRPSGPATEASGGPGTARDASGPRSGAGGPPAGGSPGADGGSPPSFPEGNPSTPSSTNPSDVTSPAASATPAAPSTPPRADQPSSSPAAPAAGPAGSPGTTGGQSGTGGASPSGGGNRPGAGGGWTGTPGTPGAAGRPPSTTDAPRASGNTGSPTRPGTTGRGPEGPPKPRAETAGTSSPPRGPERGPGGSDTSGRSPDGGSPSSRPSTGGGGTGRPPETSSPSAPERTDVPGQQRGGGDGSNRPNIGPDGPESAPQRPKDDPGNGDGSGPPRDDADRPEPGTPEYERKIDDALEQLRGNRTDSGVSGHTDPNMQDLARRVPDDGGHFTLDAHMGPDGRVHIGDRSYSPEELSDVLRRLPEWDGERPVRLAVCDSEDFAAELARELDVPVTAPRGLVWSDSSGRLFASGTGPDGSPTWPPDGGWDTHRPDSTRSPVGEDGFHPPRDGADPGERPEDARSRGEDGNEQGDDGQTAFGSEKYPEKPVNTDFDRAHELETIDPYRCEYEEGLIVKIDGEPINSYVRQALEDRTDFIRDAAKNHRPLDQEGNTVSQKRMGGKNGGVNSVIIDRGFGSVYEAVNGKNDSAIPNVELNHALRGHLEDIRGEYDQYDSDGNIISEKGEYPWQDEPTRHAEVKALNKLLNDRGVDTKEEMKKIMGRIYVDSRFTFKDWPASLAPCCANCNAILSMSPESSDMAAGGFNHGKNHPDRKIENIANGEYVVPLEEYTRKRGNVSDN
ncbi:hypothetical protein [Actinopolyspora halophila]|uniref:hypothetical protein n=1 Tax=Actinopolyspora halophila TaxID=1850 RepID=UPI00039DDDEF|nr:hypothetical protein [Actinopolyspora halophila]